MTQHTRRFLGACAAHVAIASLVACTGAPVSEHRPLAVRAANKALEDIAEARVSGKIRGATFTVADARVRIETMPGRERVELYLSDVPIKKCGLPLAVPGRRVWLRWKGRPALDGTPARVEVGREGAMSVHYEVEAGEQWLGHGGGAALLSLRDEGFRRYTGRVWVCFDDGLDSCISGGFEATACRSELDVDDSVWGAGRLDEQYSTKRTE